MTKELNRFIEAFKKDRSGRTPTEFILPKIEAGSSEDAVSYLFNIVAAEVSKKNNCKFFDFDFFYKPENEYIIQDSICH